MDLQDSKEGSAADAKQYVAEFNYEFLDDYDDKRSVAEDSNNIIYTSVDEVEKIKGFAAKWGPKGFSRWDHPLALMVRWFE